MRVVLLEDDYQQRTWIQSQLVSGYELELFQTESDFVSALERLRNNLPDLFLFDMMVPWCFPSEKMQPPPSDVRDAGPYRAGFRCYKRVREINKSCPILIYTVLDNLEVTTPDDPMFRILNKTADGDELRASMKALLPRMRLH